MRSRKASLPFAIQARKQELCLQRYVSRMTRIENCSKFFWKLLLFMYHAPLIRKCFFGSGARTYNLRFYIRKAVDVIGFQIRNLTFGPQILRKMGDLSGRTKIIAICREYLKKSRFVAGNVKNRDLSRRMGKTAIPHMPRFSFVPATRGRIHTEFSNFPIRDWDQVLVL